MHEGDPRDDAGAVLHEIVVVVSLVGHRGDYRATVSRATMSDKEGDEPDEEHGVRCGRHRDAQQDLLTERVRAETDCTDGEAEVDYDDEGRQDGGETDVLLGELHC